MSSRVVVLLQEILEAVRKGSAPRTYIYEELLNAKDEKIAELERQLKADKTALYDKGYQDGINRGSKRIKAAAYKHRKEGREELSVAMLQAAKIDCSSDVSEVR